MGNSSTRRPAVAIRIGRMAGRRRHGHMGFSLVEVLASLLLVTIVLPVVMRAITLAAGHAALAAKRTEAVALAQMKLNELTLSRDYSHQQQAGDFGPDLPDYRWESRTEAWSGASLFQVDATVTWTHRGREQAVTLTTVVFQEEAS